MWVVYGECCECWVWASRPVGTVSPKDMCSHSGHIFKKIIIKQNIKFIATYVAVVCRHTSPVARLNGHYTCRDVMFVDSWLEGGRLGIILRVVLGFMHVRHHRNHVLLVLRWFLENKLLVQFVDIANSEAWCTFVTNFKSIKCIYHLL